MPRGRHIYAKAGDMEHATMCAYPQSDHTLPQLKCVLWCCTNCPCINHTNQEIYDQHTETTPSIRLHIYHIIWQCTDHGIITLKDKTIFYIWKQESSSDESKNIYTRKESVMMETAISGFHISFYIPAIQNLDFYLPHVHILCKNHCGKMQHTALKQR